MQPPVFTGLPRPRPLPSGPLGFLLRIALVALAVVMAFGFLVFGLILACYFLLLRLFGVKPKASFRSPFAAGGWPPPPAGSAPPSGSSPPEPPPSSRKRVQELEEFHGSLDEYFEKKKYPPQE